MVLKVKSNKLNKHNSSEEHDRRSTWGGFPLHDLWEKSSSQNSCYSQFPYV